VLIQYSICFMQKPNVNLIATQIKEMESWRQKEKHNVIEWMIKNRREKDLLQRFPPHKGFSPIMHNNQIRKMNPFTNFSYLFN
jgi:hypothetical protein